MVSKRTNLATFLLSIALLVLFLWAELKALEALTKGPGEPSGPQNVALAWGVMTSASNCNHRVAGRA